jgi:hypothetical protein
VQCLKKRDGVGTRGTRYIDLVAGCQNKSSRLSSLRRSAWRNIHPDESEAASVLCTIKSTPPSLHVRVWRRSPHSMPLRLES